MTKLLIEESVVRQALEALEHANNAIAPTIIRIEAGKYGLGKAYNKTNKAITALRAAIENQEKVEPVFNCSVTDGMKREAEQKQERSWYYEAQTAWAQAHRLAMELECVLLSCTDSAAVAKWWDSAHEALDEHNKLSKVEPPECPYPTWSLDTDRWFYLAEKHKADLSCCDGRQHGTVWFNERNFLSFCYDLDRRVAHPAPAVPEETK